MINNYQVWIDEIRVRADGVRAKETYFMKPYLMPIVVHKTSKRAHVKVYSEEIVKEAIIRPMSKKMTPAHDEHYIEFDIEPGSNISLEINGDSRSAICFFVSKQENHAIADSLYYKAGEHFGDILELKTNDTLYVDKNAVLYSKIYAHDAENITICGDGIIDGSYIKAPITYLMEISNCKNVFIKDVILRNSVSWNLRVTGCENVYIENVKIFGVDANNDGIDVCGSRHVKVKNCFIRSTDDCLAVKAYDTGDVEDIVFEDCTLWNDYANPMRIGGIRADYAKNIVYKDIDVIHNAGGYPAIAVLEGNRAKMSDILFENIRIEDSRNGQMFDIRMQRNLWNSDKETGYLKDITLRNIFLFGTENAKCMPQQSIIRGQSENSSVDEVKLENIYLFGKKVASLEEGNIDIREYVKNVTITSDDENSEKADFVKSKVSIKKDFQIGNDGLYDGVVEVTLQNMSGNSVEVPVWLEIAPTVPQAESDKNKRVISLHANETYTHEYKVSLRPGKYLINSQSCSAGFVTDIAVVELPLIANEKKYEFTDSEGRKHGSISLGVDNDTLVVKSTLFNDTLDDGIPKIKIFATKKNLPEYGEAVFSVPETNEGKSMGIIQGKGGYIIEPILRNVGEILWTLNNAPRVDKVTEISLDSNLKTIRTEYVNKLCEGSLNSWVSTEKIESVPDNVNIDTDICGSDMNFDIRIPLKEIGIEGNIDEYSFEFQIVPVLLNYKHKEPITLFGSQDPCASVHMFVEIMR